MLTELEQTSRTSWARNIDEYRMLWPDTEVVRFLGRTFRRGERSGVRALDIGCGGGRHLSCLAREGFEVYGADYNLGALQQARRAVRAEGGEAGLVVSDIAHPPFADGQFDVVVAWGVLFNTMPERTVEMLREIRGMLRCGGRLLANWRTTDDDLMGRGQQVGERTYLLDDRAASAGLDGTLYTFSTRDEVERAHEAAGLRVDNVERRDLWIDGVSVRCSWWITWASRPDESAEGDGR